jgi:hypothetical protein
MIRRYFVRHRVHRLQQYFEGEFIFRTYQEKQLIAEERSPITMSYYTYPHMLLLFKYCGLDIVEACGSFDKEPIDICQEMIFVLRPIAPEAASFSDSSNGDSWMPRVPSDQTRVKV